MRSNPLTLDPEVQLHNTRKTNTTTLYLTSNYCFQTHDWQEVNKSADDMEASATKFHPLHTISSWHQPLSLDEALITKHAHIIKSNGISRSKCPLRRIHLGHLGSRNITWMAMDVWWLVSWLVGWLVVRATWTTPTRGSSVSPKTGIMIDNTQCVRVW